MRRVRLPSLDPPDNVVVAFVEEAAVRRYWQDVWTRGDVTRRPERDP